MKYLNLLFFSIFILFIPFLAQTQTNPDCNVPDPNENDISAMLTSDCFRDGLIFSYEEFQNQSDNVENILGLPVDEYGNPDASAISNENAIDLLSISFGDMTLKELYECMGIGCSDQLDSALVELEGFTDALESGSITEEEFEDILNEEEPEEGEDGTSAEEFEEEFGTSPSDLGSTLAENINNLDIELLIAQAFGLEEVPDCEGEKPGSSKKENNKDKKTTKTVSGKQSFKEELESTISKSLEEYLLTVDEFKGDPNWFLQEIEGLGKSGQTTEPSPDAMSVVNAVKNSTNMYNGTSSFAMPLDAIGAKDVSVPINVNTTPGGLHVDDQEGVLGSNMSLSAGGKITRVVKGLPDDFNGTINAHGFGNKRGIRAVTELSGVTFGVDISNVVPNFLKKILCRVLEGILADWLGLNFGNGCDNEILGSITDAIGTIGSGLGANGVASFFHEEHDLIDENIAPNTKLKIYWAARSFNYLSGEVQISIPIASGINFIIAIHFRSGVKIIELPSPVEINKKAVGYSYLNDEDTMEEFGLPALDINNFQNLSETAKLAYLTKQHGTKKREDLEFFNPKLFQFLEIFGQFEDLFNSDGSNLPVINRTQIDLEPDEYYYDFGGYSGKFYFQPNGTDIVLVPFDDFIVQVDFERKIGPISSFTFTTPDGVKYLFDLKARSHADYYNLPMSISYPGENIHRDQFSTPTMGILEHPGYVGFMGVPFTLRKRKDILKNYYVEKGPEYTSVWYNTSIESEVTGEQVTLDYIEKNIHYNTGKNWTHTFPNFKKSGDTFYTNPISTMSLSPYKAEWKNGFADLTYSVSEQYSKEYYIKEINNHRGKKAVFTYGIDNPAMPGGELCEKVEIFKDVTNFYKGWQFNYTIEGNTEIETSCNGDFTIDSQDAQGPAFAADGETVIEMTSNNYSNFDEFIYYFPTNIKIICLTIPIPIRLDIFSIESKFVQGYYFMNEISEFGSLLHLKEFLELTDDSESERYQAEFVRNFLFSVSEIDGTTQTPDYEVATFDYQGDLSELPKRFSLNQDIWGYYNGISNSQNPFTINTYNPIISSGEVTNADHFGFSNPAGNNFNTGRNWQADLAKAKIGQLNGVTLETGAFINYQYDLHDYPSGSTQSNPLNISTGGLRMASTEKGSANGVTKSTIYRYQEPTVINFPIFSDQYKHDVYSVDQGNDMEERVRVGSQPLNQWQKNKGGYVGYGKVTEYYSESLGGDDNPGDNGKVVHYFTNPDLTYSGINFGPLQPATNKLNIKYGKIADFINNPLEQGTENEDYNSVFAPLRSRDWRLGLEYKNEVFNNENFKLSKTINRFNFAPMLGDLGKINFPKSQMFQKFHHGTSTDFYKESGLFQVVDELTECQQSLAHQVVRFLVDQNATHHPYRHIEKHFPIADIETISEKVELVSSNTYNYFTDGSNFATTRYAYNDDGNIERKVKSIKTDYSNGEQTTTEYSYADNLLTDANIYIDAEVMGQLDDINFEHPIIETSKYGDETISGSVKDYAQYGDRFLIENIWGFNQSDFQLQGSFLEYTDGMPTKYQLAKYPDGDPTQIENYDFFPTIQMTWNSQLQLITREMEGFTSTNSYNDLHQLEHSTDVNGLTTNYDYDSRQRLEFTVSPGDLQTTTYGYEMSPPSVSTITTFGGDDDLPAQGQITTTDGWGNVLNTTRTTDGAVLQSITYDNLFRPITQTNLGSGTTTTDYEKSPLSRVLAQTDAVGNETSFQYLAANTDYEETFTSQKITDANGHTSEVHSNALGNTVATVSGEGAVTISKYDNKARLKEVINDIDESFTYEYNTNTGQLARKQVPRSNPETYWYDKTGQTVAYQPAIGDAQVLDYDDLSRLERISISSVGEGSFGDPIYAHPLDENEVNSYATDVLLKRAYVSGKTYVDNDREKVITPSGFSGETKTNYDYDALGRTTSITTNYPDYIGSVKQELTPINAAGLSLAPQTTVIGPGDGTEIYGYNLTIDDLLRPETTTLNYGGESRLIEQLVYDGQDRLQQKLVGDAPGNAFLQTVDYDYDAAGRLISINAPEETSCVRVVNVCQFTYSSTEPIDNGLPTVLVDHYDENDCGNFTGITLNGVLYPIATEVLGTDDEVITTFINNTIQEAGFYGDVQWVSHSVAGGIISELEVSIMNTDLTTISLHFAECNFDLSQEDCCETTLPGISDSYPLPGSPDNPDLFYEKLSYNGLDISAIETAGSCTAGLIKNRYSYDADHRLVQMKSDLYGVDLIENAFSTNYEYDPVGNIKKLNRYGYVPETEDYQLIDNLDYSYNDEGRLGGVSDNVAFEPAKLQGFANSSIYDYDDAGNLTEDLGKGLLIRNNLLNLPAQVDSPEGNMEIHYTYSGERIYKRWSEGERTYIGGVEFMNGNSQFLSIPNGRLNIAETEDFPEYMLGDHLGNTVVLFTDKDGDGNISTEEQSEAASEDAEVLQRNTYYPFGLRVDTPNFQSTEAPDNAYLYNGKELQTELKGLSWLYYGARYYDPEIGRFNSVDPLAEEFAEWSVYSYTFDNPISFIDPDGRAPEQANCCGPDYGIGYAYMHGGQEGLDRQLKLNAIGGAGTVTGVLAWVGGTLAVLNPLTAVTLGTQAVEFGWGLGTDENVPGFADDAGKLTRKGVEKLADWDTVTKEAGEAIVSFFHKGNLKNGKVAANKALSTGDNLETVTQLAREGKVHQFDIPKKQYQEWLDNDLIKKKTDLDWETGAVNSEFRFDASISSELNKYKK